MGSDESGLLAGLRNGDPAAYEGLVREYGGRLLSVARRLLRNEEEARDALQEAFISAFKAIPRFEGNASLSTWLHRIVVNAALMRIRSRKRNPEEPIDDLLPQFDESGHHLAPVQAWREDPEVALGRRESRELVRAAIDRLPEIHRTVLVLRDFEELDTAETARALGITENAVKIRLHRARQALRTLLDPHFHGGA